MTENPESLPQINPGSSGNKLILFLCFIVLIPVIALLIAFVGAIRHWFAVHTGTLHAGPDLYYNFWSGFGSDFGEATIISGVWIILYGTYRKVNCHTKGCWRIGLHQLEHTPYILCKHHHPHVPNKGASHDEIIAHHELKLQKVADQNTAAAELHAKLSEVASGHLELQQKLTHLLEHQQTKGANK